MDKNWFEETFYLTQNVIGHFYNGDLPAVFSCFHPDIVWIGAAEDQFFQGYDEVCRYLSSLTDIPECILTDHKYKTILHNNDCCTVVGQYTGYTVLESEEIFSSTQRVTFIWKLEAEKIKLLHMHMSNPLLLKPQDSHFPHTFGKQTYKYMQKLVEVQLGQTVLLNFQGKNAELYFFKPDEIIYIEANNIYSAIHTMTGCHTVCLSLNEIAPSLPGQFIRTHRSFIINRNHTVQIRRYKLFMRDGSTLPVPEKKYASVKTALMGCL